MSPATEFTSWICEKLLGTSEDLDVFGKEDERGELITVKLPRERVGRLIGREGRTISSIRMALRVVREVQGSRAPISLRILEV